MAKFIILPNGEAVRTDTIIAVRKFDATPARHGFKEVPPHVSVAYGLKDNNTSDVHALCATNEERDALASSIMAQIIADQ